MMRKRKERRSEREERMKEWDGTRPKSDRKMEKEKEWRKRERK